MIPSLKTPTLKEAEKHHAWYLIDAKGLSMGRISAVIAKYLQGKHKPTYVPYMDNGDYIVVINAAKVHYKPAKPFYWHTGYPGGIKEETAQQTMQGKHPHRLLERAVKRMLPKKRLGQTMMRKLRLFAGDTHTHEAQKPVYLPVETWNRKNVR